MPKGGGEDKALTSRRRALVRKRTLLPRSQRPIPTCLGARRKVGLRVPAGSSRLSPHSEATPSCDPCRARHVTRPVAPGSPSILTLKRATASDLYQSVSTGHGIERAYAASVVWYGCVPGTAVAAVDDSADLA
eukprot:2309728-Rhodomonas_salina.1